LEEMKIELIDGGVKIKNVPTHDTLKDCVELGRKIGQAMLAGQ